MAARPKLHPEMDALIRQLNFTYMDLPDLIQGAPLSTSPSPHLSKAFTDVGQPLTDLHFLSECRTGHILQYFLPQPA
jgi:hypothetical protein